MREYVYVECEKYEGKTVRTGGSTERSLKAMKHLPKVGTLYYVRGYVYRGRYNTLHVGVIVKGSKGRIRFGGFSWGYGGQGSRGLKELFEKLNIPLDPTTKILGNWDGWDEVGEKWRISFRDNEAYKLEIPGKDTLYSPEYANEVYLKAS